MGGNAWLTERVVIVLREADRGRLAGTGAEIVCQARGGEPHGECDIDRAGIAAFAIAGMQDEAGHGRGDDLDVPGPGPEALRPAMELIGALVRL